MFRHHHNRPTTAALPNDACGISRLLSAVFLIAALVAATLAGMAAMPSRAQAQAQDTALEYVAGVGYIDWQNGRAVASGTGAPPARAANAAQARAAARRAAVLDARRNLLEVVGQVRVDSQTRVRNLMVEDDRVSTRVQGVLERSEIISEQMLADGSVRVTVGVPLTGALAREVLVDDGTATAPASGGATSRNAALERRVRVLEARVAQLTQALETLAAGAAPSQASAPSSDADATRRALVALDARLRALEDQPRPTLPTATAAPAADIQSAGATTLPALAPAAQAEAEAATGLIVDARGTGFRPTLRPTLASGERVLYPGRGVDYERGVNQGFVRYYRDLNQAQQSPRAGASPKIIKASSENGRLEIAPEDAAFLDAVQAAEGNFLKRCQVVVVF